MVNIVSAIIIASMILQGIGGKAGIGGKGAIGGSAPTPSPAYSGHACNTATNTVTTINCTVTTTNAGEFIAVFFNWQSTATPTSVTDTNGTLTAAISTQPVLWDTGLIRSVAMFCEANAAIGSHQIAILLPSTTLIAMGVETFTGASTTACVTDGGGSLDGTPVGTLVTTGTTYTCSSITTTQNNDVIFSGSTVSVAPTPSAGVGYTVRNSVTADLIATEDGPVGAPGTYSAAWVAGGSHPGSCMAMAIKHV